jgi:hypothetical protein
MYPLDFDPGTLSNFPLFDLTAFQLPHCVGATRLFPLVTEFNTAGKRRGHCASDLRLFPSARLTQNAEPSKVSTKMSKTYCEIVYTLWHDKRVVVYDLNRSKVTWPLMEGGRAEEEDTEDWPFQTRAVCTHRSACVCQKVGSSEPSFSFNWSVMPWLWYCMSRGPLAT